MTMPLGHPAPGGSTLATFGRGGSPFDIAGINATIDRAVSALKPEQRVLLTVQLNETGGGAGLVVRLPLPLDSAIVATVTKPTAGRWGWSVGANVSFIAGVPPKPVLADLEPVRVLADLRGLFRLFRGRGHDRFAAALKAVFVSFGYAVALEPEGK